MGCAFHREIATLWRSRPRPVSKVQPRFRPGGLFEEVTR
jgi:hypothetical protein